MRDVIKRTSVTKCDVLGSYIWAKFGTKLKHQTTNTSKCCQIYLSRKSKMVAVAILDFEIGQYLRIEW